jgi:integrase
MPNAKLTKAAIDRLAPGPGQTITWDTELRGFGVLVSAKTKSYVAQRRLPGGRTVRRVIGQVGEFKTVDDARRRAGEVLQDLRDGRDPAVERRRAAAQQRTLREWFEHMLANNRSLRDSSRHQYRRSIEGHLPTWMDRPLRDLTLDDALALLADLGERAGPAAANKALRTVRAIWAHATDHDETMPRNPISRIKKSMWHPVEPRSRIVPIDDLPAFHAAVCELPRDLGDAIRLILYTGMRRSEALALSWPEVDLPGRMVRIDGKRTKSGRPLVFPMSSLVHDLLVARRAIGREPGGWVFGGDGRTGHLVEPRFALWRTGWRVSLHDLRRVYATIAQSTEGVSYLALKRMLGHSTGGDVTATHYAQLTPEQYRDAVQRVADRIANMCGIETVPAGAVSLRKA